VGGPLFGGELFWPEIGIGGVPVEDGCQNCSAWKPLKPKNPKCQ
jgi:hypothetical protein